MESNILYPAGSMSGLRYEGPFSLEVYENGGIISSARLERGFVHRGIEFALQELSFYQGILFCDRVDFLAAPACNLAYALAVESLGGVEVPERAQYIRVILLELNRISSHLYFLSQMARRVGAENVSQFAVRERELYCDLFELYCGSRLGFGSIRIGGVAENATEGFLFKIENALLATEAFLREIQESFCNSSIIEYRLAGIGLITKDDIVQSGITGPNMRASGIDRDLRWIQPYAAYAELRHDSIMLESSGGDAYARLLYRMEEIKISEQLIRRALEKIPTGNHCNPVSMDFAPAPGVSCVFIESPRGQFGVYMESDGTPKPTRVKFSTPSFFTFKHAPQLLKQESVEDALLIIDSLDISVSEADR